MAQHYFVVRSCKISRGSIPVSFSRRSRACGSGGGVERWCSLSLNLLQQQVGSTPAKPGPVPRDDVARPLEERPCQSRGAELEGKYRVDGTRLEVRSKAVKLLLVCSAGEALVDRGHFEYRQEQKPCP